MYFRYERYHNLLPVLTLMLNRLINYRNKIYIYMYVYVFICFVFIYFFRGHVYQNYLFSEILDFSKNILFNYRLAHSAIILKPGKLFRESVMFIR